MASADHPRRPKGLPKSGGRQRGVPNKRTLELQMRLVAAGAPPALATKPPLQLPRELPLDFLIDVMTDESHSIAVRVDAAKAACPYLHFRKGVVDTAGRDVPVSVSIIKFNYLPADEREINDRLTIEHDPLPTSH
jgi:hypothetical protein